ncbi:MAG: amino acid adenylation domain-containing protein, partial [Bacteroidota bacterium]
IGELCISGDGIARGYLNREELTKEKFIANPFYKGERMYLTGDLVRWLPDGNIDFIGRKDTQVKIRGYRVELEEIENTILQYSEALQQVVVEQKKISQVSQEKVLVAYYISEKAIDNSMLRDFLEGKLPGYMIPSSYVALEALPLTPNGKIDRKALPIPSSSGRLSGVEYIAPTNETENKLVEIWEEVLGVEKIGIKDNFFELGGHSLKISKLLNLINKTFDVEVTFNDLFINFKIEDQATVILGADKSVHTLITKAPEREGYMLSSSQLRLWILSQFEGGNIAYNMPSVFILEGSLDRVSLETTFQSLIERHESLRTVFRENEKGEIQQIILPSEANKFRLQYEDLTKEKLSKTNIENLIQEELRYTFDLAEDSLLRAKLLKTEQDTYIFSIVMHHIISDGWSVEVMTNELFTLYDAFTKGKPNPLAPLRIQYKDYAFWQQEQLHSENVQEQKHYWLKQFEGEIPVLDLPSFASRPTVQTYAGKQHKKRYEKGILEEFNTLCQSRASTLFMGLLAAVKVLLYRYTNQKDIVVGSPIAGRTHTDLQHQIGFYVNTLALRTKFDGEDSFTTLLSKVKEVTMGAYEHQSYPFDELVENLPIKRDMSRNPLFDVMVTFQNTDNLNVNVQELGGLNIKEYTGEQDINSKFDLEFIFEETDEGLALYLTYNTDIYNDAFIDRLTTHLNILLQNIIVSPETPIHSLAYLSEAETHQLLEEFNATSVDYPQDKTIVDLFEAQVAKTPENIAVVFEEKTLTYSEVNAKSNQFAHYLRKNYAVQPNELIGVKLDRDEQLIVVILGILKSGAAYVPIDINYPEERIAYIEEDSKSKLIVDSKELERFTQLEEDYSKENIEKINTLNDLAYIIYTSGTTGNPKGVMIAHSNAVALIYWSKSTFDLSLFDITYGVTSHCFDLSIYEMFYTLSVGKKLRILTNALSIKEYIGSDSKILLNTVPSVVRGLIEEGIDLKNVSCINMAGEVIPVDMLAGLPLDQMVVRNLYGPSEDTTYSTHYLITDQKYTSIPIGQPISNTKIHILDEALQIVPIGITGNLYVSGAGLTKGYLNREDLTREKFIVHSFAEGERMYATGDLGRWLPDGNIEFLGREDHQVKVRGYRIELGEIEHAILEYSENLKQVVVEAKEIEQEKVLAAYY